MQALLDTQQMSSPVIDSMQGLLDHYTTGGWSCINAFIGFNSTRVSSCTPSKLYCLPLWTDCDSWRGLDPAVSGLASCTLRSACQTLRVKCSMPWCDVTTSCDVCKQPVQSQGPFDGKGASQHLLQKLTDSVSDVGLAVPVQVLQEAAAVDAKAAAGQSILPLCGLPLAVKDSIDVLPYPTSAATPALLGGRLCTCDFLVHLTRSSKLPALIACAKQL